MKKYTIKYYLGKDFYVSRVVESDGNEEVTLINNCSGDTINFQDRSGNVFYSIESNKILYSTIEVSEPSYTETFSSTYKY
ncbi:hypothetical protein [Metabacillus sp. 84]|uniref:hypothetical protein n=1 Tax=Metabacillus sp. 84 TaxID=3404705 RepID=UPI003CF752BC